MPLVKLLKFKKLSPLRRAQLRDDLRITHAWYHTVRQGGKIYSKGLNKYLTLKDIVMRHALIAIKLRSLGYIYPDPKKLINQSKIYLELIRRSSRVERALMHKSAKELGA